MLPTEKDRNRMRIIKGILAGALAVGCSVPALAETNGWYVGAQTGFNYVPKMSDGIQGTDAEAKFDPGVGVLGQVGYGFGQIRLEGELGYRYNKADTVDVSGFGASTGKQSASGSAQATTLMLNALYDFNTGTAWTPYIGAGIGGAYVNMSSIRARDNSSAKVDDSDLVFAYQGIAGISYDFTNNLAIKADYRYLGTQKGEFDVKGTGLNNQKFEDNYTAHSLMVGFTYKFNAPAAPVMAAPAVAPAATQAVVAKSYLVFFDFDKSDITPEARTIILQAADVAKSNKPTSIELIGHTDSVGTAKYNMALSLRRANAVKAVLVAQGVPASEIAVVGRGMTDQLVPTADGVREPQNRRVQIVLQ